MVGAVFIVGSKLLQASWVGRHIPHLVTATLPLMLFLEEKKGEAYKKYRDLLERLGISEDEAQRISLDEGDLDKIDLVLHFFTAQELEEMAGPSWEKYLKGFVEQPLCLLNREVFVLEKVFETLRRTGTMGEIHFSFNVLEFSHVRLTTPEFLASAGITQEQLDEVFGNRKK